MIPINPDLVVSLRSISKIIRHRIFLHEDLYIWIVIQNSAEKTFSRPVAAKYEYGILARLNFALSNYCSLHLHPKLA